jgi:serine/threonine protein kinase
VLRAEVESLLAAHVDSENLSRDLKPSNILEVPVEGKPRPKIIDFGLAKATVPAVLGESMFTHVGGFPGTPGYMSPEQADPSVRDIDTRTDVYPLSVILYELLTGLLPSILREGRSNALMKFCGNCVRQIPRVQA